MEDDSTYGKDSVLKQVMSRMNELERKNAALERALQEVAEANAISDAIQRGFEHLQEVAEANSISGAIQQGFEHVIAELQPLRDLTQPRESIAQPAANAVTQMLAAMQGVKMAGGDLKSEEPYVPFIGQPRAAVLRGDQGQMLTWGDLK